jgi:putative peptidoglycan lipid II flippase
MSNPSGDSLRDRLTKATLLLVLIHFLSRLLGFVRDATIAYKFGLSGSVDAYYAAIHVPDILNYLVAGGALSSTFVPLFQEYWQHQREQAAWRFFAVVGSLMLVLVVALVLVFEIWTRPLVLLVYGHGKFTPAQLDLVVRITRIVLPGQICFVVGGLINGVIYSIRGDDKWYVAVPAIGSVIYNLGIIVGGLVLASSLGVEAFAWGGLVGVVLGPFLLVALAARNAGARFHFHWDLRHPGLRRFVVLTLPLMIAVSYSFVDQIIAAVLGVHLPEGSIGALNNAYRLMLVPVGMFGITAATAAIGTLAGLAATRDHAGFRRQIREALGRVGVMVIPVTVLMIVLAEPAVRLVYQRGEFDAAATARVAAVLRWYALGMYAWSANYVLSRGLYSLQDTLTPALLGTITTAVMFPLSWVLMRPMGAEGLALATTIGITLQSVAIFIALRKRLQGLALPAILRSLRRMLLAALAMAAAAWGVQRGLHALPATSVALLAPASGSAVGLAGAVAVALALGSVPAWIAYRARLARLRPGPTPLRVALAAVVGGGVFLGAYRFAGMLPPHLVAALAPASHSAAGALVETVLVAVVSLPVYVWVGRALGEEEVAYLWGKFGGRMARFLKR